MSRPSASDLVQDASLPISALWLIFLTCRLTGQLKSYDCTHVACQSIDGVGRVSAPNTLGLDAQDLRSAQIIRPKVVGLNHLTHTHTQLDRHPGNQTLNLRI